MEEQVEQTSGMQYREVREALRHLGFRHLGLKEIT